MKVKARNCLSNSRTVRLLEIWKTSKDPAVLEQIVILHKRLVYSVARRYASAGEPLEDLVQEGFIGLLRAVDLYDPSRGVRFSTYACHKIIGSIQHYLRDKSRIIRHPAWIQELRGRVIRELPKLREALGRHPDASEIASHLEVDEEDIRATMVASLSADVESLDEILQQDLWGESPLPRRETKACRDIVADGIEDQIALHCAIDSLPIMESRAIKLFYLNGLGYQDLARTMHISTSKARRLVQSAIVRLRQNMFGLRTPPAAPLL